jgi:hypothetical protein
LDNYHWTIGSWDLGSPNFREALPFFAPKIAPGINSRTSLSDGKCFQKSSSERKGQLWDLPSNSLHAAFPMANLKNSE